MILTNPIKHSDLLEALGRLFGVATGTDAPSRPSNGLAHDRSSAARARRGGQPGNRTLVTALLGKRGHTVKAVENGRLAVAAVGAEGDAPFDVVLMDLQMPEMGGLRRHARFAIGRIRGRADCR